MKLSKGYEEEQHTLQKEQTSLEKELQKEEKQSVDVKQFLSVVRKYTNLTELTPEIVHEFIDKIIVHAPDKSSGKRLQEIALHPQIVFLLSVILSLRKSVLSAKYAVLPHILLKVS